IQPRIVIIETYINYGLGNRVVPYDPSYSYPGKHPQYHGASPAAMVAMANKKGYRLVGANHLGFNFFFVREDLLIHGLVVVTPSSVLKHPSVVLEKVDPVVMTFPFEKG